MKYQVVLPYAFKQYRDECMSTCKLENVFEVDNTVNNIGIMRSHNMGIDLMKNNDADWLIILSAAVRFGRQGGLDFVEYLEKAKGHLVVEASGVYGWHLIAFSRGLVEKVGRWDENFTPYGYDDLDYSWRIQKAFGLEMRSQLWNKVHVSVGDMGMAHSIHRGGIVTQRDAELRDYYTRKWGGMSGKETYSFPFNDPLARLDFWPKAKNGGYFSEKIL